MNFFNYFNHLTSSLASISQSVWFPSNLFAHLMRRAVAPHPLHISQQRPKKRMPAQRGRITHQQQLAPCTGHAHVHAADGRQEADLG